MRTQRMGWMAAMLAIAGFGALSLAAQAEESGDKPAEKAAVGTIASVAEDHGSFELQMGEGEQSKTITVTVTDETKYKVNGEEAAAADVLVVGKRVKVWHKDAVASKVSVMETGKDKNKEKGADKGAAKEKDRDKDTAKDKGSDKDKSKGNDKDKGHEGHGHEGHDH